MPCVALLIETSTGWGAGIVGGIADYAQQSQEKWQFFFESRGKFESLHLPPSWEGDGVIARVNSESLADEILRSGTPCVNVSWYDYGKTAIARCTLDELGNGRLAAKFFLDRSYTSFAYCGSPWRPNYVDLFGRAYAEVLREHGFECHVYPGKELSNRLAREKQLTRLSQWLSTLPCPCALLTIDTETARLLVDAADLAKFKVPEDFAILAGDSDDLAGRLSTPRLSMIDNAAQKVGYGAARLLDRILQGDASTSEVITIPPTYVKSNQSTDWTAVSDPDIVTALRFIRDNFQRPIQVADIVEITGISRRALEQRFMEHLETTPHEQIVRQRIAAAKRLLEHSDMPIQTIATRSGFASANSLSRCFRQIVGAAPSTYRKHNSTRSLG